MVDLPPSSRLPPAFLQPSSSLPPPPGLGSPHSADMPGGVRPCQCPRLPGACGFSSISPRSEGLRPHLPPATHIRFDSGVTAASPPVAFLFSLPGMRLPVVRASGQPLAPRTVSADASLDGLPGLWPVRLPSRLSLSSRVCLHVPPSLHPAQKRQDHGVLWAPPSLPPPRGYAPMLRTM